jgi:hypothetical protein
MLKSNDPVSAKRCSGKEQGVCLNARQASWAVVTIVGLGFFAFITGYFWGKRTGAQELSFIASQESLTDQVYSSLCVMNGEEIVHNKIQENTVVHEQDSLSKGGDSNREDTSNDNSIALSDGENHDVSSMQTSVSQEPTHTYYAQLVGFGTKRAADRFVARLDKHGIDVTIATKSSKTSKGISKSWYQAVTKTFSDKAELQKQINQIKVIEHLHDVRIITI